MIDLEWLRRLIELLEESEIDSLEVRRLTTHVKISKSPPAGLVGGTPASATPSDAGGRSSAPGGASGTVEAPAEEAEREDEAEAGADLHEVKSPMVGTFYRAPAPDAPPYVEVGDPVKKGQTLCILEAMKLMNELESEVAGVVREVAVENAEPVEFGQVLFRIEAGGEG